MEGIGLCFDKQKPGTQKLQRCLCFGHGWKYVHMLVSDVCGGTALMASIERFRRGRGRREGFAEHIIMGALSGNSNSNNYCYYYYHDIYIYI